MLQQLAQVWIWLGIMNFTNLNLALILLKLFPFYLSQYNPNVFPSFLVQVGPRFQHGEMRQGAEVKSAVREVKDLRLVFLSKDEESFSICE